MNPRFNNQIFLDAAEFILKSNSLTFDSMFFLQLKGATMGTVFAPTYANLTKPFKTFKFISSLKTLII